MWRGFSVGVVYCWMCLFAFSGGERAEKTVPAAGTPGDPPAEPARIEVKGYHEAMNNLPRPVLLTDLEPGMTADDPARALGLLRVGNGQCTGTIVAPQNRDGTYDIFCANHCGPAGQNGTFRLSDGRVVPVKIMVGEKRSDGSWLRTSIKLGSGIPAAKLAKTAPAVGTRIWHKGFGRHLPGNLEKGVIQAPPDQNAMIRAFMSVSPGDSGGGWFREDTGELVASTCCTTALDRPGNVWGCGPVRAAQLRPGNKSADLPAEFAAAAGPLPGHPASAIVPMLMLAGDH